MAPASSESFVSEALTLVWLLLIATVVATYFIQRYRVTLLPPSTAAMTMGIICGGVVKVAGLEEGLKFSPSAFFYGLLPPIVFAAGFTLKKREFFRNFGTISLFSVAGTFISSFVFGFFTYIMVVVGVVKRKHLGSAPFLDCMLYGSLISATDPVATLAVFSELDVPPLLYNVVFGESVLNDAVAVVLFSTLAEFYSTSLKWSSLPLMISRFIFIGAGSLTVGIAVALACAFVLKRFQLTEGGEHTGGIAFNGQVYEITIIIMSAYLAYLVAEVFMLSGIVALFFTAICHAHYSYYSVEAESQISLRAFFEFAAFLSETFVFIYLGLQVARLGSSTLDWGLLITGVPLCLFARAANIFPLAQLANLDATGNAFANMFVKLTMGSIGSSIGILSLAMLDLQVACGLRGAIAFGLAMRLPQIEGSAEEGIPAIESATLIIVVFSTLVFGGATGPLLNSLELKGASDVDVAAMGFIMQQPALSPAAALQLAREVRESATRSFYTEFKAIDVKYLKPLFGGRVNSHTEGQAENEALLTDGEDDDAPSENGMFAAHDAEARSAERGNYHSVEEPDRDEQLHYSSAQIGRETSLSPTQAGGRTVHVSQGDTH